MNTDDNERDVRINYYFKGPIIGLLLDIDIRRKTQHRHSLDDVMRQLYSRFYRQLQRGFSEEEFWQVCADVAGQPLTDIRHLVETTDTINYPSYLHEAGLRIDSTDWSIRHIDSPSTAQQQFLRSMKLAE